MFGFDNCTAATEFALSEHKLFESIRVTAAVRIRVNWVVDGSILGVCQRLGVVITIS
jgi:hypothetical protein